MVESALPIVLLVGTSLTSHSSQKLLDALKLKQRDSLDLSALQWTIVTNYYTARVQIETF